MQAAVSLGKPIMSEEWVHRCWESRDEINVSATDEHLVIFCWLSLIWISNEKIIIFMLLIFQTVIDAVWFTDIVWMDDSKLLQIASYYRSQIYPQGSHAGRQIMLYGQLQVKDLPRVSTWRLEWDSNLRPSRRKAHYRRLPNKLQT